MAIKTGRYGQVFWDAAGGTTFAQVISLNAWSLDAATELEDVTCFGDTTKVYIPGMPDAKGEIGGFWNSADTTLWKAANSGTPGTLKLVANSQEPGYVWQGLAYMSASIDCSLAAPKITGSWGAAASWTMPGVIVATGATAGLPGTFTPAGATPPQALANMTGIVASPGTNWTVGQHVELGNGSDVHWNGTAWTAGVHP
jgi:hypothetical protein